MLRLLLCLAVHLYLFVVSMSNFLHTPNRINADIVDSFCVFCQTFIGASPSPAILRMMEEVHACPEQEPCDREKKPERKRKAKGKH